MGALKLIALACGCVGGTGLARPRTRSALRPPLRMRVDDARRTDAARPPIGERRLDDFGTVDDRAGDPFAQPPRLLPLAWAKRVPKEVSAERVLLGVALLLATSVLLPSLGETEGWGLLSAKIYMNGLHSRIYLEQFASAGTDDTQHMLIGAGLPQLSTLVAGFAGGLLTTKSAQLFGRDAPAAEPLGGGNSGGPPASGTTGRDVAGVATGSDALAESAAPPATVWLLQVAVRNAQPAGGVPRGGAGEEESAAALLWQQYAKREAEERELRGAEPTAEGARGVGEGAHEEAAAEEQASLEAARGEEVEAALEQPEERARAQGAASTLPEGEWNEGFRDALEAQGTPVGLQAAPADAPDPVRAKRAADAADACVALLRCAPAWEAARVSRSMAAPRAGAAHRAVCRLCIEEQCRAPFPAPHMGARAHAPGVGRGGGGVAEAQAQALSGAAAEFIVVTLLVATTAELDVPGAVHSVAEAREALLELAGALRGQGDDIVHVADFATTVQTDEQGERGLSARDNLYLLFPSLCPL